MHHPPPHSHSHSHSHSTPLGGSCKNSAKPHWCWVSDLCPGVYPVTDGSMSMPERSYSSTAAGYRWGFNNMEKDDELKGSGNSYDFGARIYDPRVGRWLAVDPLAAKYPDSSPYSFASNNSIYFLDPDGKEVIAYSAESQDLVLKTLKYAFGENHGFSFENNKLIHNGQIPKDLTPQQSLMLLYFNETLINSHTPTFVNANSHVSLRYLTDGSIDVGGFVSEGNATTFFYPRVYSDGTDKRPSIIGTFMNDIIVTPGLMKNGILLGTAKGDRVFSAEHALLHEFAHVIINTIMHEYNGYFNEINFNEFSYKERLDWAIRFTNTLLQSQKKSLETGEGQHERSPNETPNKEDVAPLTQ